MLGMMLLQMLMEPLLVMLKEMMLGDQYLDIIPAIEYHGRMESPHASSSNITGGARACTEWLVQLTIRCSFISFINKVSSCSIRKKLTN